MEEEIETRKSSRRGWLGGALGTLAAGGALAWPRGSEPKNLDVQPINPRIRQAILYDHRSSAGEYVVGAAALTASAVAGGSLGQQTGKRRDFLKKTAHAAGSASVLAAGLTGSQYAREMHEESRALEKLKDDLLNAGYALRVTSDSGEFMRAMDDAKKDRDPQARTIVVLNAHGVRGFGRESFVETTPQNLAASDLASFLHAIPGNVLLASPSCQFNPQPFFDRIFPRKGHVTLMLGNGGKPENSTSAGFPFYQVLRQGLREPDVLEGSKLAAHRIQPSLFGRFMSWLGGAEFSVVRIGHSEPFRL